MRKFLLLSVLTAAFTANAQDNFDFGQPKSERIASYQISAELNADAKMVAATETITWKNNSRDTIRELMFHTYLNAFKNSQSTYFREAQQEYNIAGNEWGYIDVQRMVIVDGEPLTQNLKYVQPDDNNTADQTVLQAKLSSPILPGKEIKIAITFLSKLPKIINRTGYERGDFYMVGQWFPKIGVYESAGTRGRTKGGWNCHQFHYNSEFYSDFGTYDVEIAVPEKYRVAATGLLQSESTNNNDKKVYKFHADDVIDFGWAASPRFEIMVDTYNGKGIKLYYMPEHGGQAERYIDAVKNAMEYMSNNVGDYQYPVITIVDCPFYATQAAFMEYPMLITASTIRNISKNIRAMEAGVVHEFVHNYFMAVVANNEAEEPWLDEGFTQFYECQIMDNYYGKGSLFDMFSIAVGDMDATRLNYTQDYNPAISSIENYSWKYPTYTYEMMAYSKPAVMLQTLKGLLGDDNFKAVMIKYYEKWKFKHPSQKDFETTVNSIVSLLGDEKLGNNLDWFFDSMVRTDQVCDYKLTKIVNRPINNTARGFFDNGLEKILSRGDSTDIKIKSSVYVQRMGTMVMPVDILVTFDNGDQQLYFWNGKGRCHEISITGSNKIVSAQIDPENKIACDINMSNNAITDESATKPLWKYTVNFLFWLQNLFQTVTFFA